MHLKILLLFVTILIPVLVASAASKCNPRDYNLGSVVCVCSDKLKCEGDFVHLKINANKNAVTSYRTTKSGDRFEHHEYSFELTKPSDSNATVVRVEIDSKKKFQKIIGFGGAVTDSTGYNIVKLPKDLQNRLVRDYFAPEGIEYRMARIPIGGTDFSNRDYSLDDHPNDDNLEKFELQAEDFAYKIPFLRMAQESTNNSISYFGSAWSSPAWMKTNNKLNHGGFLLGEPGGKYYKLYAKYLVKFIEEYLKQGVNVWGLTVVNEPQFGWDPNYLNNALGFTNETQRDFVKLDLGPELERAGLKDKKIMIFDDNVPKLADFVSTVLSDQDASKYVAGVAFHWYDNKVSPRGDILDGVNQKFPEKFLLSTEACQTGCDGKNCVLLGSWKTFDDYAHDVMQDLNHHTSGWIDWNMVLDTRGGPSWVNNLVDAPIIVNASAGEYYKQPIFYALGHFSKFLIPGSVRIHHEVKNASDDNVEITVFERPDMSKVLTVLNKRTIPIHLQLHDPANGFVNVEVKEHSLESLIWH